MGLVNEYTTVGLNSGVISYYENIGYEIPRSRDKEGRLRVQRGTTIDVKTIDLMPSSNQKVDVECDYCKKHKRISYHKYNQNINNNNGFYLCSVDENHRNFSNGVSYEKIIDCIKCYYDKMGNSQNITNIQKKMGFHFLILK